MNYPDSSTTIIPPRDGADGARGATIELHLGRKISCHDAALALRFEAVVADARSAADPRAGTCTIRLSIVPERGEVSTCYLSLDPDVPELATVSAFGYRISLRDVTPCPAEEGARPHEAPRATVVLDRMRSPSSV